MVSETPLRRLSTRLTPGKRRARVEREVGQDADLCCPHGLAGGKG